MPDDKSAPKPGHFLPGGAGEDTTAPRKPVVPGDSAPLTAPTPRLGGPSESAGPPQLSGSRLGPPPLGDPAAVAFRARYQPEPIVFDPKKKSKALIAAIVAGVVLVVGGGVAGVATLLSKYDDFVANPIGSTPSLPGDTPTSEQTKEPTPDPVVEKENKLYANGKIAAGGCKEPGFRPTSKENVRSYYEVLLKCLNKSWQPVVEQAGFDFHEPALVIFDDGQETACGVQEDVSSSYCDTDGGRVEMPWQDLVDYYQKNKAGARIAEADAFAYVYAIHVQKLTGIFDAADNLSAIAPTPAARLEHQRRQALQASCLAGVFLGAEKASFPIQGELLKEWQWRSKHDGDELTKDKVRDHGSRKSTENWRTRGFTTADPGSCNTFAAPAAQVS